MNNTLTMKKLLESGAHFGHNSRYWNPKMKPYIFMKRQGIHIIDLQKTVLLFQQAYNYVKNIAANGGKILFVCTKKQGRDIVENYAKQSDNYYINKHWIGGLLTNLNVVRRSISKIEEIEKILQDENSHAKYLKRDLSKMEKTKKKLQDSFGGVMGMKKVPDLIFVIDTIQEKNCIEEAKTMNIPICALVDTNSNPEDIDVVIPSNDDAIHSITLFVSNIAKAIEEGKKIYESNIIDTKMINVSSDDSFDEDFPNDEDEDKDASADTQANNASASNEKPHQNAAKTKTKSKKAEKSSAPPPPQQVDAALVKEVREITGLGFMECKKALVEASGNKDEAIRILKERGLAVLEKKASREANEGLIIIENKDDTSFMLQVFCETDFVARNEAFVEFASKAAEKFSTLGDSYLENEEVKDALKEITSSLGEKIALGKPVSLSKEANANEFIQSYLHTNKKIAVLVKIKSPDIEKVLKSTELEEFSKDIAMQIAAMNPLAISSKDISEDEKQKEREIFLKQMEDIDKPNEIKEKIVEGKVKKYFAERCLMDMSFVKDSKLTVKAYLENFSKAHGLSNLSISHFERLAIGKE